MDIKKEIVNSVISAATQKSVDISTDLIFKGKIQERPVTVKRIGIGAALTTTGIILDSNSPIKGNLARIARSMGMTSLTKSAIDSITNKFTK